MCDIVRFNALGANVMERAIFPSSHSAFCDDNHVYALGKTAHYLCRSHRFLFVHAFRARPSTALTQTHLAFLMTTHLNMKLQTPPAGHLFSAVKALQHAEGANADVNWAQIRFFTTKLRSV